MVRTDLDEDELEQKPLNKFTWKLLPEISERFITIKLDFESPAKVSLFPGYEKLEVVFKDCWKL